MTTSVLQNWVTKLPLRKTRHIAPKLGRLERRRGVTHHEGTRYAHAMHALEVIAYHHPSLRVKQMAFGCYSAMVRNLHLNPETEEQHTSRMTEDRMGSGTVCS